MNAGRPPAHQPRPLPSKGQGEEEEQEESCFWRIIGTIVLVGTIVATAWTGYRMWTQVDEQRASQIQEIQFRASVPLETLYSGARVEVLDAFLEEQC